MDTAADKVRRLSSYAKNAVRGLPPGLVPLCVTLVVLVLYIANRAPVNTAMKVGGGKASDVLMSFGLSGFGAFVFLLGSAIVPAVGATYVLLRTRVRRDAFLALFTDPRVCGPYLASRGRPIAPRRPSEGEAQYEERLRQECVAFCNQQFRGEFGRLHWLLPLALASVIILAVNLFLVAEVFGKPVHPQTVDIPVAVFSALLGATVWSLYVVFRDYTRTDLTPATFYWVSFRYLLAVAFGFLGGHLFAPEVVKIGAFTLAVVPFEDSIRFLRSKVFQGAAIEEPAPKLTLIQGLPPEHAERLHELGVHTVQQLAYGDPLRLLLGSNFSPMVLIDWMDQAMLYIYLEQKAALLRPFGVRGAIEGCTLYYQEDRAELLGPIAATLGICEAALGQLFKTLSEDTQVQALGRLWGTLDQPGRNAADALPLPSSEGSPVVATAG